MPVRNFIAGIVTGLIAAMLAVWLYPWAPLASDEELWKVASFVSRIGSLPPAVAASWRVDAP